MDHQKTSKRPAVANAMEDEDVPKQSDAGSKKQKQCRDDDIDDKQPLVEAARVENAADDSVHGLLTPLNDCLGYLKRNPAMREVIGELIRHEQQEQNEETNNHHHHHHEGASSPTKASQPPAEESNTEIQHWMDEFQKSSNPESISKDFSRGADDYYNAIVSKVGVEDDDGQQPDDDDDDAKKVADPATEPFPTAALQALVVHFDTTSDKDRPEMVGFTMKYSDGVETQSVGHYGSLVGTKKVHLQLQPNEHFVYYTAFSYSDTLIMRGIRLFTTESRQLEAYIGKPLRLLMDETDRQHIASQMVVGDVIRRIWPNLDGGGVTIDTVPMTMLDQANDQHVPESLVLARTLFLFPTLAKLAYDVVASQCNNKTMEVERNRKAFSQTLGDEVDSHICQGNRKHEQKLQSSHEATLYRALVSLVSNAKTMLDARASKLLASSKTEISDIISQAELKRGEAHIAYAKENLAIFKAHQETYNLSWNSNLSPSDRGSLCFVPECRNIFYYNKVASHKRCAVPGCVLNFPNCGCSITECDVCHEILCKLHFPTHQCAHHAAAAVPSSSNTL